MTLEICGRPIARVKIIDDDPAVRASTALRVEDAGMEPILEEGPLPEFNHFIEMVVEDADAVICDYKLMQRNYASFNGAEVVADFYDKQFPAVLYTAYYKADIDAMRPFRRKIPSLISAEDTDRDLITHGFEVCLKEFEGYFSPSRISIKTLVRIEDVDLSMTPKIVFTVVPGWNPKEVVRFPLSIVPEELRKYVKPGERFYAEVNTGAEEQEELFFINFEYRG